ncbi:MAG TPA: rhomboid family intramembrane serine protease [Solirubrobacteraceae bacterium]|jgi:membrane associated rhomboid family serine protease|nr:rhomboid family intramembrane serine protease [Solirubrobacteraceae bacterium]
MSSGADLFVVCKKCGSEVSPYITECPYCGNRLRRRAPKLPREHTPQRAAHRPRLAVPALGRLRRGEIAGIRADTRPYATVALVAASCVIWVLTSAGFLDLGRLVVVGPLHRDWWKLLTTQFVYGSGFYAGVYAFCALAAVAVFGWLLERRHGPAPVLVAFFGAGAAGVLVALAVYPLPIVSGANAGALALLAAWAVPDLRALRAKRYYDGDLLGTATFAAVLLAMPFARPEASWAAGVTGAAVGLVLGYGLATVRAEAA